MKRGKVIVLLVLLLAGAGLLGRHYYLKQNQGGAIFVSGHIEATEVDLSFRLPGHVKRLLVDEGQEVARGDLVAELEQEVLQARHDQAAARVQELEARVESLALALRIKEAVTAGNVDQAKAAVSAARARYLSLKRGSREQEIREAAAARDRAQAELDKRQADFKRMKRLYAREIISASQFEEARTAYEAARAAFQAAQERYELVKAGPREEMVREGRAHLSGSAASLGVAQAGVKEVEKMKLDLKALRAQATQARAALALAEDDLAESRLSAPLEGFVTVKAVEEGEFVQAGAPVVTLARLSPVWVKTFVPETRLGRVRLGQEAEVRTDSFPDKVYPGRVTFISSEAEFTPKNVQTREERVKLVYRIKVTLDNPQQELKVGMPVDVVLR